MTEPTRDALTPTNPTPTGALAEAAQTSVESPAALPWLGHVTALRSWKQGGLGEVLVGRDEQLHRDVAFKRIKVDRLNDPDARRRFELEAEITAKLEHPGIVPIYGMVQGADGQPCYVMRFIHGDTLKSAIQKWHTGDDQPKDEPPGLSRRSAGADGGDKPRRSLDYSGLAFRALLQKFITVCETMTFAHRKGIIHRDLKPENVMLGKYGETLVVDWGLAKPFGRTEIERSSGEASLTMPPTTEGDQTQMGHAAGTPAYMSPEQATGRWNVVGPASDIYSLGAILYEMLTGQAPIQGADNYERLAKVQRGEFPRPRQRRSEIAKPLDAICLKAMALKPEERYRAAKELAGDVEHWLADEAVSAYGEPGTVRAGRWMRRHRTVVTSGAVALALGVVALTAITVLAQQHAGVVEGQRNELAERYQALTAANQALNAAHAHERLLNERARQAIETVTSDTAIEQLTREKELRPEQKDFLDKMIRYYAESTQEAAATEAERSRQARAYFRMGRMNQVLGRFPDSETACRRAVALQKQLAVEFPARPEFRAHLAGSYNSLGILLHSTGRLMEEDSAFTDAVSILKRLAADFPTRPEFRQELSASHNNLGILLRDAGRQQEAESAFADAVTLQKQLAADFPSPPPGSSFQGGGSAEFRQGLAASHINLGRIFHNTGRPKEAESAYADALAIQQQLAAEFPNRPEFRHELAMTQNNLGILLRDVDRRQEAESALAGALAIRKQLAADFPNVPDYRNDAAGTLVNLAKLARQRRDFAAARRLLDEALPYHQAALQANPRHRIYRQFYRNNVWELTLNCAGQGDRAAALATATKRRDLGWNPAADAYDAACALALCVPIVEMDDKLDAVKRQAEVEFYADEAMKMLRDAIAKGYKDIEHLKKDDDLKPLRERDDYKKLVKELEAKP